MMPRLGLLLLSAALCAATIATAQTAAPAPPEVGQAVQALAKSLNIPATQVRVVRWEEHTWPDSSLGCRRPGQVYSQVLVPGYLILLEAKDRDYEYHSDRSGHLACSVEAGVRPQEVGLALADLSARLQVPVSRLLVQRFEPRDWPDVSLGCPQAGVSYAQVVTPGYYILLRNGVDEYEYHSDRHGRVSYCSRNIVSPEDTPPVVEAARRDLAERLGCSQAEITIAEAPFVDWAPETLGVPYNPGFIKQARQGPGYRPVFRCRDRQYEYRTDLEREVSFVRELPPATPESYRLAYLALAKDPDGYNLWDLTVRDSVTGNDLPMLKNVVDFSISPSSGRAVYLRRMPGDRMTLWGLEKGEVPLLSGPDFRALSWDTAGTRYTAWGRELADSPWRLVLGKSPEPPVVYPLETSAAGPGLPQPAEWQGNLMAYVFDNTGVPTSMVLNTETGTAGPLGEGRFTDWLDTPGDYLRIANDELIADTLAAEGRPGLVAKLPGLVWAKALPGSQEYAAVTQEGGLVRLWTGPLRGAVPPRMVSELNGEFVRAQLSDRGTLALIQQIAPMATSRRECQVTLVELQTGHQEPLQGVCVRAQLLPPRQRPQ